MALTAQTTYVDETTASPNTLTSSFTPAPNTTTPLFREDTPDSISMSTTGDHIWLIATGGTNPIVNTTTIGDTLQASGIGDVLNTDGATGMTFINNPQNPNAPGMVEFDQIYATTQHSFHDIIMNWHAGDELNVYGFTNPSGIPSATGLPSGVTITTVTTGPNTGAAQLNIDFTGGNAPTATIQFPNVPASQLAASAVAPGSASAPLQLMHV